MKKYISIFIVFFLCSCFSNVYGQISTKEKPVSFRFKDISSVKETEILPSINIEKLRQEDIEDEKNGIPPRFGYPHAVNFNLDNSGEWTILPTGDKIWRLSIGCPGALSINLLYNKFWLPEGAKFFV